MTRHFSVVGSNVIDLKEIGRISISEETKLETIIAFICIQEEIKKTVSKNGIEIKYRNLFNEDKIDSISNEFISKIEKIILGILNNPKLLEDNSKTYIVEYCCESCVNFMNCKNEAIANNSVIQIPQLTKTELDMLHKQGIENITNLQKYFEYCNECKDESVFSIDKKNKISKFINIFVKNENITCFENYYLNYTETNNNCEYIITLQGHAQTDVVYYFDMKKIYEKDAEPHFLLLEEQPRSKEAVLKYYNCIISSIHKVIKDNLADGNSTTFCVLANYEKKNLEKV